MVVRLPEQLPQIQADPHQLTQVFTNLLLNAYEAMNGQGRITVSRRSRAARGRGGRSRGGAGRIADDGPGIPQDVAERIFEPFFTTKSQGSGLGLAIVRKIVDAHDGRIDLETAPGAGTTIRITLPVTADTDGRT